MISFILLFSKLLFYYTIYTLTIALKKIIKNIIFYYLLLLVIVFGTKLIDFFKKNYNIIVLKLN